MMKTKFFSFKRLHIIVVAIFMGCFYSVFIKAQPSTFSLRNSHVTMPKGYNDFTKENSGVVGSANFGKYIDLGEGNWFKGATSNGRPSYGTLHKANGLEYRGGFDAKLRPHGVVLTIWPDGDWYYGNYINGVKHGEGSWCLDGEYYDVIMSDDETVSSTHVVTPRFNKANYDAQVNAANNARYNSSNNSSSTSRSSGYTNNSRRCNVCGGSGKCYTCNGKGYYVSIGIGSGTHRCTNCNQTGRCPYCKGTGNK